MAPRKRSSSKAKGKRVERARIERLRREALKELKETSRHLADLSKAAFNLGTLYTQTNILPWARKELRKRNVELRRFSKDVARKVGDLKASISKSSKSKTESK